METISHDSLYSMLAHEMSLMSVHEIVMMVSQVSVEQHHSSHPIVGKIVDTCNLHSPTQYYDAPTWPPGQYDPLCGLWYYGERYLTKRWVQGVLSLVIFAIPAVPTFIYFFVQYVIYVIKTLFYTGSEDYMRYNKA